MITCAYACSCAELHNKLIPTRWIPLHLPLQGCFPVVIHQGDSTDAGDRCYLLCECGAVNAGGIFPIQNKASLAAVSFREHPIVGSVSGICEAYPGVC